MGVHLQDIFEIYFKIVLRMDVNKNVTIYLILNFEMMFLCILILLVNDIQVEIFFVVALLFVVKLCISL